MEAACSYSRAPEDCARLHMGLRANKRSEVELWRSAAMARKLTKLENEGRRFAFAEDMRQVDRGFMCHHHKHRGCHWVQRLVNVEDTAETQAKRQLLQAQKLQTTQAYRRDLLAIVEGVKAVVNVLANPHEEILWLREVVLREMLAARLIELVAANLFSQGALAADLTSGIEAHVSLVKQSFLTTHTAGVVSQNFVASLQAAQPAAKTGRRTEKPAKDIAGKGA